MIANHEQIKSAIQAAHERYQIEWNRVYERNGAEISAGHPPSGGYPSLVDAIMSALTPYLAAPQDSEQADTRRLDWLLSHEVEIYIPHEGPTLIQNRDELDSAANGRAEG